MFEHFSLAISLGRTPANPPMATVAITSGLLRRCQKHSDLLDREKKPMSAIAGSAELISCSMSRRHAVRLDVGALVPCLQVLRSLAALLVGLQGPWAFPGEARHCCLRHRPQNGAKTTDRRNTPTGIVFWQPGRGQSHQGRGRGKDKK
jgi:hypothetical protein